MKKLLIKYGLIHTINGLNQALEAAEILNDYDEIVLSDPNEFGQSDKILYFQILQWVNKPVWVYVPMCDNYNLDPDLTVSENFDYLIKPIINNIRLTFNSFNLLHKLKGFFLDEFGYDYRLTINTTPQSRRHQNRVWQNLAVNYCHSLGYPVFVNAWFIDEIADDIIPPLARYGTGSQYLGKIYPLGNDFREGEIAPTTLLGSGNWYGKDYILFESVYGNEQGQINLARLMNVVGFMKKWGNKFKYACIQAFNYSNKVSIPSPPDGSLIVDENFKNFLIKCIDILHYIGIEIVGISDIDYAASSNIVLDVKYNPDYYGICDDLYIEREGSKKILKIKKGGELRSYEL